MKKFLITLILMFFPICGFSAEADYQAIYRNLEMPDFSYIHGLDPEQHFETKGFTWSPYPLFRLNSALYLKNITIVPGYYLLTPREYKGRDYLLFKESGQVRYIIPVYKKDFVPEFFYDTHLPKAKLTFGQKFQLKGYDLIGKVFPSAKRKPMPQTYLEITDLDNNFVSVVVYYKEFKYYTIFRTVKM